MRRVLFLLLVLWPVAGAAQSSGPVSSATAPAFGSALRVVAPPPVLETPAGAFAASLLVPGSGQAALGLKRWLVYGALEISFWAVHFDAAADFRRYRTAYRDLAWDVARSPTGAAARQEGSWEYYEHMSQWLTSGTFDRDPVAAGIQPELDVSTYNGMIWDLARGLYLPPGPVDTTSADYQAALAYYSAQAAGPDFLWSWVGHPDALDRFRDLIGDADSKARLRSTAVGLVLANHLVSAVDALVVARLRGERDVHLESRLTPAAGRVGWTLFLRVPISDGL